MNYLRDMNATNLALGIVKREYSVTELLEACFSQISAVNHAVNAVVALDEGYAQAQAKLAERSIDNGDQLGPLHGIPVLIKDTQDTDGLVTTYGSPIFEHHIPQSDHECVARLRKAGAIILGKTNTPEFAAGGNTRNTVYGATGNAFNPKLSAAGSSGGSAVALACGMAPLATGSDTGGSLRNPAAYAGIVGFRPSYGLVTNGRRLLGWSSLATDGPMARTVSDVALMLSVLASDDTMDPLAYTLPGERIRSDPGRWLRLRPISLAELRIAYTEDFGFAPTEGHIRRVFRSRIEKISQLTGSVMEDHPDCSDADEAFAVLRAANFLAAYGRHFRERPQMLGPNVRSNIEEALTYTLEDYAEAAAAQTRIYRSFQKLFERYHVLLSPSVTLSPRSWDELYPAEIDGRSTKSYFHWLALAYAATIAGNPAISLPCGIDEFGLPFGIQIIGPRGGDAIVLRVAAAFEEAFAEDSNLKRPTPDLVQLANSPPISEAPRFRARD